MLLWSATCPPKCATAWCCARIFTGPKPKANFPVLLTRTPYDKRGEMDFGPMAAARGYVVVAQDVRGRYTSEGEWYTFKYESQDGYDTVEWAAALALFQRQGGDVRRLVRWRHADARRHRRPAAPGRNPAGRDRLQLS